LIVVNAGLKDATISKAKVTRASQYSYDVSLEGYAGSLLVGYQAEIERPEN
jgi:hypothetical protein